MKKVLILYGGNSNEHEISCKSKDFITDNIDKNKYIVDSVLITKNNIWLHNNKEIKNIKELARKLFLFNIANPKYQLKEEKMLNLSYLEYIFTEELRMRNDNKIKERLKVSCLPNLKWKDRKG